MGGYVGGWIGVWWMCGWVRQGVTHSLYNLLYVCMGVYPHQSCSYFHGAFTPPRGQSFHRGGGFRLNWGPSTNTVCISSFLSTLFCLCICLFLCLFVCVLGGPSCMSKHDAALSGTANHNM